MKTLARFQSGAMLIFLFVVIILTGCNTTGKKDQAANTAATDTVKKEVALSAEAQSLLKNFPTPFEVTTLLEKSKAGYIFNITNPPANVDKYNTEKSRALNLGVYSADLCYSATYKSLDKTNIFIACTKKLADNLGIAGIYDQDVLDRIKKFNNNKDSLIGMINRTFGLTNDFLSKNNRNQVAVLITAGGFTESLFLCASLAEFSKDNSKIMAVIASQKDNYNKLMTILQGYNADANVKPVADEMAKLQPLWEKYGIDSGKKITQENAKAITVLAESVRATMIK